MFLELNCSNFHRRFSQYGTLDDLTLCDFFTSLLHDHFFVGLVRCALVPSYTLGLRKSAVKMAPRLPSFLCTALHCLDCLDSPTKKGKSASRANDPFSLSLLTEDSDIKLTQPFKQRDISDQKLFLFKVSMRRLNKKIWSRFAVRNNKKKFLTSYWFVE